MRTIQSTPASRIRPANERPPNPQGKYILYWMTAARRTQSNFALQLAIEQADTFNRPLLVLEAVRCGYQWASARFHKFLMDGMEDNAASFAAASITYYPYIEPKAQHGCGLLDALARQACVVITDEFPSFFLPRMVRAAATQVPCSLLAVDGNGILPLALAPKVFTTAFSFRRHVHKSILGHLDTLPETNPLAFATPRLAAEIPPAILKRWPTAPFIHLQEGAATLLRKLPIDQAVLPTTQRGGARRALELWQLFLGERLEAYPDHRNQPHREGTSRLSPYLHFGHISSHTMVGDLLAREEWTPAQVAPKPTGSRAGWWGLSPAVEAYLDQLITWREVGYTFCHKNPDTYGRFESLPNWALETLSLHQHDPRPDIYQLDAFESAQTHDPIWNAAQRQLVAEGTIHNYLRMLWGKKILHWSETPQQALSIMTHLNNKYALDGRNPNSTSGIFWTLGRFDRAWGPERPIFGKVRYMSSESAARKLNLKPYLARWSQSQLPLVLGS